MSLVARISAALRRSHARPAVAQGIRAGIVTVSPLVIGALTGHGLAYSWVALGAFEASLADNGGPYKVRAVSMTAIVLGGTAAVFIGSVASRSPLVAVPLALTAAFVSGMVRVYGSAGAVVGVNNLVMTLVALAYPSTTIAVVRQRAEFFFIGAAVSAVAALVLWPFQPNNPARQAMAECFDRMAALLTTMASPPASDEHDTDAWHLRARRAHVAVREALEEARQQVVAVRLARGGAVRRGDQLLALLVVAERLLGFLLPLPDLIDSSGLVGADDLGTALRALAGRLARVAAMVRPGARIVSATSDGDSARSLEPAIAPTMRRLYEETGIAEAVASALQRGAPMPDLAAQVLEAARALVPRREGRIRTLLAPLRDNWGFQSLSFQHAVRLAVGVGAAQAVAMSTGLPRGYWLTVTTGIILQPYAGATVEKAIQRVVGTVVGVLIAALITLVLHGPLALTLILFPLTVLTFALRPISYGYFVLFLTPIFVLLAEGLRGDPHLAAYRLVNTVLGGVLAMTCGAILWPAWEGEGLADVLATAVDGDLAYLRSIVGDASTAEPDARRAMGLANGNAEAALQRVAAEGPRSAEVFEAGTTVVAVLRRLGAALSAIGVLREATADPARHAAAAALVQSAEARLGELAASLRASRRPAPIASWPPVDERQVPLAPLVVRQVEVLHSAVSRFVAARPVTAS